MNTNLEYYKFFYYVGKLHSITLAAEELNVSQPAVSQAIRNLERELGTTLFMRTSRGVRLTAEGQTLYGYVQRGYETIREGERKFLEMQELTSGEVCIGASDMTLQFYLLSYLEQLEKKEEKHSEFIHNMNHYLKAIGELAREEHCEQIVRLMEELNMDLIQNERIIYTHHKLSLIHISEPTRP